ncbi:2-C-methyl-D-erythritol 4-phosphate cytidylyltransferase [Acinetobacter haemolyticus]|uniref:2-C-methyl-D-erythritol 4-phosphate cytidylyltransferase n=1 Tax=Acinetobacter haemolyticus TaxID=29430 RepID=UPI000D69963B|nr:2-C-methyl-D-erythritol 4-phosphate cytidylyltransferase [Acinetobacter haemolyticus]
MRTKLWAVVPAAGSGSRFSKTELKQYQYIQNQTVLEHTVNRLHTLDLAGCVLAISEQDTFAKTLSFHHQNKMHFCLGGTERVHSVLNALIYLSDIADENDWILVHDAARPCVASSSLQELVRLAIEADKNSILAIPVRDTLKQVQTENKITKTVSREFLWQAQTPQMAKLKDLKHAIEVALANDVVITDEASALEYIKQPVQVVQGRSDNIKITYKDDLELARLILQSQTDN